MAKGGDVRVTITLECTSCTRESVEKKDPGVYRYTTQKNRRNTIGIEEILSLLLQAYYSRRDEEIDRTCYSQG